MNRYPRPFSSEQRTRNVTIVALLAAGGLSLAACGGGSAETPPPAPTSAKTTTVPATPTSAPANEAHCTYASEYPVLKVSDLGSLINVAKTATALHVDVQHVQDGKAIGVRCPGIPSDQIEADNFILTNVDIPASLAVQNTCGLYGDDVPPSAPPDAPVHFADVVCPASASPISSPAHS